jgi:hypothetical protein
MTIPTTSTYKSYARSLRLVPVNVLVSPAIVFEAKGGSLT